MWLFLFGYRFSWKAQKYNWYDRNWESYCILAIFCEHWEGLRDAGKDFAVVVLCLKDPVVLTGRVFVAHSLHLLRLAFALSSSLTCSGPFPVSWRWLWLMLGDRGSKCSCVCKSGTSATSITFGEKTRANVSLEETIMSLSCSRIMSVAFHHLQDGFLGAIFVLLIQ